MKKNICFKIIKNITIIIALILFLIAVIILKNTATNKYDFLLPAKKCVLFIGDGMGENHIKVASSYLEKKMSFESFEQKGYVITDSLNLFGPTDSAASASAMATGKKYKNGRISFEKTNIQTISEYCKQIGFGVGIITTDDLFGATPAAFSAHAKNRGDTNTIIKSQMTSNIDLLMGAGIATYHNYKDDFLANDYLFIDNTNELTITNKKVIATFSNVSYHNNSKNVPSLNELVDYAYSYFETNYPDGYFLMIEEAHIDKRSHNNDIFSMINHVNALSDAVSFMFEQLKQDDYFIMVTADHETGSLRYNNESKESINNNMYQSTNHSSTNVLYFISSKSLNHFTKIIDNTEIYQIFYHLIKKEVFK